MPSTDADEGLLDPLWAGRPVASVTSDAAILSVGEVNPYGHPHPSIVSRYHSLEIPLRSTAVEGTIHLDF